LGLRILKGEDQLRQSTNAWDWLGPGIYFWEQNPEKALEYAEKCAAGQQKFSGTIKNPFVIGAIIELGNCLNLVEPNSLRIVKEAYHELLETMKESGTKMPKNKEANRRLDCAVIQNIHESIKRSGTLKPYDTIRSPFHEGVKIYEDSNFTDGLHIEISVRTPELIKGYFLPRPIAEYNPYLHQDFDKVEYQKLHPEEKDGK